MAYISCMVCRGGLDVEESPPPERERASRTVLYVRGVFSSLRGQLQQHKLGGDGPQESMVANRSKPTQIL